MYVKLYSTINVSSMYCSVHYELFNKKFFDQFNLPANLEIVLLCRCNMPQQPPADYYPTSTCSGRSFITDRLDEYFPAALSLDFSQYCVYSLTDHCATNYHRTRHFGCQAIVLHFNETDDFVFTHKKFL